jgi:hypothetical protein
MVIRQWATGGGGGTEQLRRVHPGTGDRRQPVDERGGERILGHAGDDLVEQPAPFLQRRGQVASHLAVEVPLPGPGGLVQLHGAGGTPVIRADLHRGPPHLHLPEDVSGDRAPALGCPFGSVGVGDTGSNLVGQCGDQIGSGGQATSA